MSRHWRFESFLGHQIHKETNMSTVKFPKMLLPVMTQPIESQEPNLWNDEWLRLRLGTASMPEFMKKWDWKRVSCEITDSMEVILWYEGQSYETRFRERWLMCPSGTHPTLGDLCAIMVVKDGKLVGRALAWSDDYVQNNSKFPLFMQAYKVEVAK